jgi:hypothetical protein
MNRFLVEGPIRLAGRSTKAQKGGSVRSPESHEALMTRLYSEHNQALIRFLMTRLDSEQEAQDVAHEAYVRMLHLDARGAVSYLSAYGQGRRSAVGGLGSGAYVAYRRAPSLASIAERSSGLI